MKTILLMLAMAVAAWAQNPNQGVVAVVTAPSGNCVGGVQPLIKLLITNSTPYDCQATGIGLTGTWTAISGGGGGGPTIAGTAGQIVVAGAGCTSSGTCTLSIASTFTFPGTVTNNLSIFGATTSAQLLALLTNPTGTGFAVFSASPALTGSPTAPTQTLGDSTTKIATDAFVQAALPTSLPPSGSAGGDLAGTYPNPTVKASVGLTGTPTAPTASAGDNTTQLATDAFVTTAVANAVATANPATSVLAASTASLTGTYSNGVSGVGATFTVTATGAFTLDGTSIGTIGQRVLLKNQSSAFQNGVYTATVVGTTGVSPVFTRAVDYDQPSDINNTGAIFVQTGTANILTSWLLTSTVATIGTDALNYSQSSSNPSNLVTAASPGAGIAHFPGSSQAVTSSPVSLTADVSGVLPTANIAVALANQTSINGLGITASTGTLTIANGKTASVSNTLTFTGTDSSSVAFGAGGTATYTIASGTSAMGTGAISSATCASVVTTTATGTATTDVVMASFNGDPTAVTGYVPLTTGMLTIISYPTSGNVNFKVCNNTSGSITPGAITLNWRVVR